MSGNAQRRGFGGVATVKCVWLVLTALAACALAGAGSSAVTVSDPKAMVLQLRDLPLGFERTRGLYVSNAEANRETKLKKDFAALGRINGYEAEFTKETILGILQVTTVASTYKTPRGAHESLVISARSAESATGVRFRRLSVGARLGHEARLYGARVTRSGTKIDVFSLLWRSGSVYAGVLAGALAGSADPADVVALGRKQHARILATR